MFLKIEPAISCYSQYSEFDTRVQRSRVQERLDDRLIVGIKSVQFRATYETSMSTTVRIPTNLLLTILYENKFNAPSLPIVYILD